MELKFDPKDPKYEYITDAKRLDEVLDLLSKERAVGVDVETTGFDAYTEMLLTVQLGTPEISYIVDARKIDLKKVPKFKELLENTKIIKILQNGKFDYKFIKHQAGAEICNIYDTMLAEGVLMAGLGSGFYGLQGLVSKYLGFELSKEARSSFQGMKHRKFTDEQLKYGALDTLVLFPIFEKQIVALKKEKIFDIAKLEFAATRVVAEMEYRGIFIDVPRWKTIVLDLREKRDKHAIKFYNAISPYYAAAMSKDLFGDRIPPININSQVQLMDLFNNKLGLDIPSTGDAVLAIIDHEIAVILREYRKYEKLISAFGDSLLEKVNSVTGRLHPSFNQLGAATGRFSCRDPNLQQIPRNSEEAPFRECFNPQPGYKLVTTDYGSFEMRVLAELSNDDKFIHALKEGLDVHSYTAALMFGLEYTDDFKKKYPEKRQAAKAINFGLMYGMGPGSLARQIDVSKDEAVGMMNKYFESYPKVKKFLNKMATNAVRNGWSSTPGGRKRWYKKPDESDPDYKKKIGSIQRQAKNHPIQGTNADAVKYALVFLHDRMKKEGIDGGVTHTVHDEVVCEVPNEVAEKWADIQSEEMIRAAKIFLKNVPVTSDPFVGDVWEH